MRYTHAIADQHRMRMLYWGALALHCQELSLLALDLRILQHAALSLPEQKCFD